jgi:hypothetical protein
VDPKPSLLGLQASFGFGDRLGPATPGHIDACKKGSLLPVFAQQSVRELERTKRTPQEVMAAAQRGIKKEVWTDPWGADADHLKTREDVDRLAKAGFTFFTIDPSDHVDNRADHLEGSDLRTEAQNVVDSGAFESLDELESLYLNKSFDLPGAGGLAFMDKEILYRAAVKYGRAIAYSQKMAGWIRQAGGKQGAETEISVDETDTPTSPEEHLFIALELKRRDVEIVSLAPRFPGDFEKGIDYKGDLNVFESTLVKHVAISRRFGPYKISVHSGSDKFKVYPILGRVCGDLLHVKTAGTSYLEALRVVARKAPALFVEIIDFSRSCFDTDRASYHISAELGKIDPPEALSQKNLETVYLDEDGGRQVLHVTFGSVLTAGKNAKGRPFKEAILETLDKNESLHRQVLADHLGRHITSLNAG